MALSYDRVGAGFHFADKGHAGFLSFRNCRSSTNRTCSPVHLRELHFRYYTDGRLGHAVPSIYLQLVRNRTGNALGRTFSNPLQ